MTIHPSFQPGVKVNWRRETKRNGLRRIAAEIVRVKRTRVVIRITEGQLNLLTGGTDPIYVERTVRAGDLELP